MRSSGNCNHNYLVPTSDVGAAEPMIQLLTEPNQFEVLFLGYLSACFGTDLTAHHTRVFPDSSGPSRERRCQIHPHRNGACGAESQSSAAQDR